MKKVILLAGLIVMAIGAKAQIGYKGQVALGISGGIDHVGGFVGAARVGGYLSEHSVLGAGVMFSSTRYDATQGDSFQAAQWLGEVQYQYAIPLNKFIILPAAGLVIGGESCDQFSRQGNILPYKNQFVYGVMLQCDLEYILGRHWAIVLEPRMLYLIKTHFESVKVSANIGIKYYF